jgi:hypothetical protein
MVPLPSLSVLPAAGFLMASANSLDLRPATAMASVRTSGSNSPTVGCQGPHGSNSSGRQLSSSQQQRSFTDLDSSEGFVKEVSLGHLSASLFTPSGVDANARVPLQKLWGSFEVGSAQSSFSSRDAAVTALQHQQQRQQCASADARAAAAAEQPLQQQQQQQLSCVQQMLSPTRGSQGAGAGFLQRLTDSTQRRDADSQQSIHQSRTGAWCAADGAEGLAGPTWPGSGVCRDGLRSSFGRRSRTTQESQQQHSSDVLPGMAGSCSKEVGRPSVQQQPNAGAVLNPIVAWGAPAAVSRPASRRAPSAADVASQLATADPQQLQHLEAWAVPVFNSKDRAAGSGKHSTPAGDAGVAAKQQQGSSASVHASQQTDVGRHGPDAVGSGGQAIQQPLRPPSRQRPPSESLHLFNSFAALM